jgi:hypothetical protein
MWLPGSVAWGTPRIFLFGSAAAKQAYIRSSCVICQVSTWWLGNFWIDVVQRRGSAGGMLGLRRRERAATPTPHSIQRGSNPRAWWNSGPFDELIPTFHAVLRSQYCKLNKD